VISYFLATRSSQMNVEAANDVDPKCWLNLRYTVSVQVCVGIGGYALCRCVVV